MVISPAMNEKMKAFAPVVLRISLALVFLWFSYSQLTNVGMWTAVVPDYAAALSGQTKETLVYANGIFELVFGILLLLGLYTRVVALLLALHLIGIIHSLGYNAIAVRDFGLCLATFAMFFNGSTIWSLDALFSNKKKAAVSSMQA